MAAWPVRNLSRSLGFVLADVASDACVVAPPREHARKRSPVPKVPDRGASACAGQRASCEPGEGTQERGEEAAIATSAKQMNVIPDNRGFVDSHGVLLGQATKERL